MNTTAVFSTCFYLMQLQHCRHTVQSALLYAYVYGNDYFFTVGKSPQSYTNGLFKVEIHLLRHYMYEIQI